MSAEARTEILRRVRTALADIPPGETADGVAVARDYLVADPSDAEARTNRFVERVAEYRAVVHRVEASELPREIALACERRGVRTLVIPADMPDAWLPEGIHALRDHGLTHDQLNAADGVLTGCALGIAQTGTLVLDAGPAQGRRAISLLPDYHLCVVREDQVVGVVPEGVRALEPSAHHPDRPMTWISGPSATSDIELSRVEGVHGPRTLEVLVVKTRA